MTLLTFLGLALSGGIILGIGLRFTDIYLERRKNDTTGIDKDAN